MSLSSAQRTAYECLAGAVVLIGCLAYVRHDIAAHAVADFKLAATQSRADSQSKRVDTLSIVAASLAQAADEQHQKAVALVAAGKAAQVKSDSIARLASAQRDADAQMVHDSAATASGLRANLVRLDSLSRADSAASATRHLRDVAAISGLVAVVAADSIALRAEQQHTAALLALNGTLSQQISILKQSATSKLSKALWGLGGAGIGYLAGRSGIK